MVRQLLPVALLLAVAAGGCDGGAKEGNERSRRARHGGADSSLLLAGIGGLGWPAQPGAKISSTFGVPRTTPTPHAHAGLDIAVPEGTLVAAAADGIATVAGWVEGYGNVVYLDHGDGYETRYAHNRENLIAVGEEVTRGQAIAVVGTTGHSTGPHIHFEVRKHGDPVDPMTFYRVHPEAVRQAASRPAPVLAASTHVALRDARRVAPAMVAAVVEVAAERCLALDDIRALHPQLANDAVSDQQWIAYGYALASCGPDRKPWEALGISRGAFRRKYVQLFLDTDHSFPDIEPVLYRRILAVWGDTV